METNMDLTPRDGQSKIISTDPWKFTRSEAGHFELKVEGHLDKRWSVWLGRLDIHHEHEGTTRLRGLIPDQAALFGVLLQLRDLGLHLISLQRLGLD